MPKTCHVAVLKPNRNSLQGLSRVVLGCQSRGSEFSKAAAEVFEILKLLKAPKPCHVAVSKPSRNSSQSVLGCQGLGSEPSKELLRRVLSF